MTTQEQQPAEPAPDDRQPLDYSQPDSFLQELVAYANDWGIKTGVTLTVGGLLVSGQIISGKEYFERFAETYAGGFRGDRDDQVALRDSLKKLIEEKKMRYTQLKDADGNDLPYTPPGLIHLDNCRIFHNSGAAIPTDGSVLWRGTISRVDGFSLGMLNAS